MAFKKLGGSGGSLVSPETMFNDSKAKKVKGLLAHQADIIRNYVANATTTTDVAIQLPTGSGKTLVGLLIAEWRRRKFGERVVYLCPTNQLVNQVVEQATTKYGIQAIAFTGSKHAYDQNSCATYQNSESIAVTSYSSLFNVSPFFSDPNLIILDDAHSAENYIASYWSLEIDRFLEQHKPLYNAICAIIKQAVSQADYDRLVGQWQSPADAVWVDKLPTPALLDLATSLRSVIDKYASSGELQFRWSVLRSHFEHCHLYYGARGILIRPFLPPTSTHTPFSGAAQKIYMSATLGAGGELERLFGTPKIMRLEVPSGWDTQGIGRRFFVFPHRGIGEQVEKFHTTFMQMFGRSLVLVPRTRDTDVWEKLAEERLRYRVFMPEEIEASKAPFIASPHAVAIVANRYDGIDFAEDECRLLFMHGLPSATNLQEAFIVRALGAVHLLSDRILTRVVQAFGRCTRSPTDYSMVVITGNDLITYLMSKDRRSYFHPEIQAELEFGIENSKDQKFEGFVENAEHFIHQDDTWLEADASLVERRDGITQKPLDHADSLRSVVAAEIRYQNALWNTDYERALEEARKVLSGLQGEGLKGYRGLWFYFAGCAAYLATKYGRSNMDVVARDFFDKASRETPAVRWLNRIRRFAAPEASIGSGSDLSMTVIERFELVLESLGLSDDGKYARFEAEILEGIENNDATKFERSHEKLGTLLGYDSGKREEAGSPDPWWLANESLCFVFEDHSDAKSETLSIEKARQVSTHANWVTSNVSAAKQAQIKQVLISSVARAHENAIPHLSNVLFWRLSDFRQWTRNALSMVREIRRSFPGTGDIVWRAEALELFRKHSVDPDSLLQFLEKSPANIILK